MANPTAADLIRVLLELDQQVISPRPSSWGQMAEIVWKLCQHAERDLKYPDLLGDWRSIDLSPVRRPAPRGEIRQPTVERLTMAGVNREALRQVLRDRLAKAADAGRRADGDVVTDIVAQLIIDLAPAIFSGQVVICGTHTADVHSLAEDLIRLSSP